MQAEPSAGGEGGRAGESSAGEPDAESAAQRASPLSRRGTLRRNVSLPSMANCDEMSCGLLPRSSSLDDGSSSDEEDNLMEVDGKAVLAAQSERLKHKSNPYVGTFHYGHRASKMLTGQTGGSPPGSRKSSPPQQPQPESHAHGSVAYSPLLAAQKSPACGSHDAAASVHLVQAPPPLGEEALDVGPVQGLHRTDGACQDNCRSRKPVDRGPDPAHAPLGSPLNALNRERMKQALQLVESVPADPEMCGLQALLPRQAGVQVQYKIGEGSFGKCVKVLNRKNRQQWSKVPEILTSSLAARLNTKHTRMLTSANVLRTSGQCLSRARPSAALRGTSMKSPWRAKGKTKPYTLNPKP
jgi:hypothetical protein